MFSKIIEMGSQYTTPTVAQNEVAYQHILTLLRENKPYLEIVNYIKRHPHVVNHHAAENGKTLLHVMTEESDVYLMTYLLHNKGDINAVNHAGETALHIAARRNHQPSVKLLLKQGAALVPDKNERLPLHYAINGTDYICLKLLIDYAPATIDFPDKELNTVLHLAIFEKKFIIAKQLVVLYKADIFAKNTTGLTAAQLSTEIPELADLNLMHAVVHGNIDVLNNNREKLTQTKSSNNTPIVYWYTAAFHGQVGAIEFMLANEIITIDCQDGVGNTLLHAAAHGGHVDMLDVLMDKYDLLPSTKNKKDQTSLFVAALRGNLAAVKVLLREDDLLTPVADYNRSVFHAAIQSGNLSLVIYLYTIRPAFLTELDLHSKNPFMVAACYDQVDIMKHLISLGASPSEETPTHKLTAFLVAAANNSISAMIFLLYLNPDFINAKDRQGNGAHVYAAMYGYEHVLNLLFKHGFPIQLPDQEYKNILFCAIQQGRINVMQYLLQKHPSYFNATQKYRDISAIAYAAANGQVEALECLISSLDLFHEDPVKLSRYKIKQLNLALIQAVTKNNVNCIKHLINNHPTDPYINFAYSYFSGSCLLRAAYLSHKEAFNCLLSLLDITDARCLADFDMIVKKSLYPGFSALVEAEFTKRFLAAPFDQNLITAYKLLFPLAADEQILVRDKRVALTEANETIEKARLDIKKSNFTEALEKLETALNEALIDHEKKEEITYEIANLILVSEGITISDESNNFNKAIGALDYLVDCNSAKINTLISNIVNHYLCVDAAGSQLATLPDENLAYLLRHFIKRTCSSVIASQHVLGIIEFNLQLKMGSERLYDAGSLFPDVKEVERNLPASAYLTSVSTSASSLFGSAGASADGAARAATPESCVTVSAALPTVSAALPTASPEADPTSEAAAAAAYVYNPTP